MLKILTEGSKRQGFGHIVRCSTILEVATKQGISAELLVNAPTSSEAVVNRYGGETINWTTTDYIECNIDATDIVVIDSYQVSCEVLKRINDLSKLCVVIDDNQRVEFKDFIILNPNAFGKEEKYDESNVVLAGAEYTLTRSEFDEKKKDKVSDKVESILITFGGTDIKGLTFKVVDFLLENNFKGEINVVIGNSAMLSEIDVSKYQTSVTVYKEISAKQMAELLSSNDFVISAAGQTVNEIIKTLIPSILIKVVDNQEKNLRFVLKKNCCLEFSEENFSNILLMFKTSIRIEMHKNLQKLRRDGNGAERLLTFFRTKGVI